jgi:hypothetical protein
MLDIEIIKWGCEFADGFKINMPNKAELFCNMNVTFKLRDLDIMSVNKLDMYYRVVYPLFLQRVRKGINKNDESDYFIDLSRHYCRVIDWGCNVVEEYPDTDEGLEKAIEYIYSKVVEDD